MEKNPVKYILIVTIVICLGSIVSYLTVSEYSKLEDRAPYYGWMENSCDSIVKPLPFWPDATRIAITPGKEIAFQMIGGDMLNAKGNISYSGSTANSAHIVVLGSYRSNHDTVIYQTDLHQLKLGEQIIIGSILCEFADKLGARAFIKLE